jgi:hypothetical protein
MRAADDVQRRPGIGRLLAVVAIFAGLGPILGIVVASPVLGLGDMLEFLVTFPGAGPVQAMLLLIGVGLVGAFVFGWLQGLVTGLVMALWVWRTGAISSVVAACCSLAMLAVRLNVGLPTIGAGPPSAPETPVEYGFVIAAHIVSAIACTALARRLFVPVSASEDKRG